jgi:predicted dehydrogenase
MKKVRVAVIGIGGRGNHFAAQLAKSNGASVAALVDSIPAKAEWAAKKWKLSKVPVYRDVAELLKRTAFDAALIATADAHHAEAAVPLLKAGKFVFCEKPLETTLKKCRAIVAADEAAGGKTFVGFNLRYAPAYATIKRCLDAGTVGRILTIQADEFYDGGRTYFRRWNGLRSEGGGLWITKASHDFDLLHWMAGTHPLEVHAVAAKSYYVPRKDAATRCRDCKLAPKCPDRAPETPPDLPRITEESGGRPFDLCLFNTPSDTFDHGIATVAFEKDIFATYTCNVVAGFSDRRMRVSGTKGTLDGALSSQTVTFKQRDPSKTEQIPVEGDIHAGHGGADDVMLDSFLAFVRGKEQPKCRPREAAVPICMGLAATLSGDEHRTVKMSEMAV